MAVKLVKNIMSHQVISVSHDVTLPIVLAKLAEQNISFVVVKDDVKAVGVITERDIVRLTAEHQELGKLTAKEVMSSPVVVFNGSDVDIAEAYHRLKLMGKRHLVVVDDSDEIQGVVTLSDFVDHLGIEAFVDHKPLSRVLTADPITVAPTEKAMRAVELMSELKISCIIVVEEGFAVGIITERDVARARATNVVDLETALVNEVMTHPVVSAPSGTNTFDASKLMKERKIRHLVVVNDHGHVIGVVTETNIVQGMEGRYVQSLVELLDEKDSELRTLNENLEAIVKQRTEELMKEISAHKALQSGMLKLTQALEQAGEAVIITDTSGLIEYVNEAFEKTTGYSAEEALGQNPNMLQSGRQDANFYQHMWKSIIQNDSWKGVVWNKRKNGEIYPEQLHVRTIRNESGEVVNYVGTFSDISEKMAMESEYRHAQRLEAIGSLVGGVAHNFNNILAAMFGNLYFIRKQLEASPSSLPYLESLEALSESAADMIRQLLTFVRKQVSEKKVVSLNNLMMDAIKTCSLGIPENIELNCEICDESLNVFGDETQLQQVIMNLINNARDAIGEEKSGVIDVSLRKVGLDQGLKRRHAQLKGVQLIEVSIEDNGSGIPKENLVHIFEPFFTTKEVNKGTGLGLSMSKGAIDSHGGAIEVDSEAGRGTLFHIYLPISVESEKSESEQLKEVYHGDGELILLVDDDKNVLKGTESALISLNYNVITAMDGEEAFKVFLKHKNEISIIITDVVMPRMGGTELVSQIRSVSSIPVIYLTGYGYEHQNQNGDTSITVLPKPFLVHELSAMIADVLKKRI